MRTARNGASASTNNLLGRAASFGSAMRSATTAAQFPAFILAVDTVTDFDICVVLPSDVKKLAETRAEAGQQPNSRGMGFPRFLTAPARMFQAIACTDYRFPRGGLAETRSHYRQMTAQTAAPRQPPQGATTGGINE